MCWVEHNADVSIITELPELVKNQQHDAETTTAADGLRISLDASHRKGN